MKKYYVNKKAQANGDHEVHIEGCRYLPKSGNKEYLGAFISCRDAVKDAEKIYSQTNGCYICCNACHTS